MLLQSQLSALNNSGLIRLIQSHPEIEYLFKHALVQDAAYASLLKKDRKVIHLVVGEALEHLYADRLEDYYGVLAYHFRLAESNERAVEYLFKAAQHAEARYANEAALQLYTELLPLLQTAERLKRYEVLLACEHLYDVLGQREPQLKCLQNLEVLANELAETARQAEVCVRRAYYAEATSDFGASIASAQQAVKFAQAAETVVLEAAAHLRWGRALMILADYPNAEERLHYGLVVARRAQALQVEADILRNLGIASAHQGRNVQAQVYFEESLQVAETAKDLRRQAMALNNLGIVLRNLGAPARASQSYERSLTIAQRIGDRRGMSNTFNNLGFLALRQSQYLSAQKYCSQALQIYTEVGDQSGQAISLHNLGEANLGLGVYTAAQKYYEQAVILYRQIGDRNHQSDALAGLGLLFHHLGDNAQALHQTTESLAIAKEVGALGEQARALLTLGHIFLKAGQFTKAQEAYTQAYELWQQTADLILKLEAAAGLAQVALVQNDLSLAQARVEEIAPQLQEGELQGAIEPMQLQFTCYRVWSAAQDPRAANLLHTMHQWLHTRADQLDADLRSAFWAVPVHRELLSEFARNV